MPSASINGNFKLEGAGLLNMGSGSITTREYKVRLSQRGFYYIIRYYVEILFENVSLSHYNAITRSLALFPVSVLF